MMTFSNVQRLWNVVGILVLVMRHMVENWNLAWMVNASIYMTTVNAWHAKVRLLMFDAASIQFTLLWFTITISYANSRRCGGSFIISHTQVPVPQWWKQISRAKLNRQMLHGISHITAILSLPMYRILSRHPVNSDHQSRVCC